MKRYFDIFITFLKNNLSREMEFRGNFLMLSFLEIVWVVFQVLIIQLMFQYTDEVFGWTKFEIIFLIGFFRLTKGLIDTFIRPNFLLFPTMVTKGDLDFVLTKPVNSIYMISTRRQDFVEFSSALTAIGIMIYALPHINLIQSFTLVTFSVGLVCSFVAFYAIFLSMTITAIFIPRLTALRPFYDLMTNFARFPGQIFTHGVLVYTVILIPIFLISTLPVQIMLGKSAIVLLIPEVVGAIVLFVLSLKFWNFSIKYYSSASS